MGTQEVSQAASWTTKQPGRGIFTVGVTMAIALLISTIFEMDTFIGIFTVFAVSMVPIEVIMGLGWGNVYPQTGDVPQPWRGILRMLFMAIIGTLTGFLVLKWIGNGVAQPLTNVYIIATTVLTFWAVLAFQMWPFQNMSPPARGFLTLISCFVIIWFAMGLIDFRMLSYPTGVNPSPMPPVPFYEKGGPLAIFEAIAPKGPIGWEIALAFWIWMLIFLWVFIMLNMWPFCKIPSLMKQPVLGITLVAVCAALGYMATFLGVVVMKIEPIRFMLDGISFLFGALLIIVCFEMWPGRNLTGLAGGFLNIALSIILAIIGFYGIEAFCQWQFGAAMKYPANWMAMANVMLSVTFPIWAAYTGFLECWPLPSMPAPDRK